MSFIGRPPGCHSERSEELFGIARSLRDESLPYLSQNYTCHPEGGLCPKDLSWFLFDARDGKRRSGEGLKSFHCGLVDSIKATFRLRSQPLSCFSRVMALRTSPKISK
jgi:hypothetical protein